MLFQIINYSKPSLHRHIIGYTKQICMLHFKKNIMGHKCQRIFYCTSKKAFIANSKISGKDKISNYEFNKKEELINEEGTFADLKNLYVHPQDTLNTVYARVENEIRKNCLSLTHKKLSNNQMKSTINVSWPKELSFSYIGSSKRIANNHVAWMCLDWLLKNKKIYNNIPLIYDREEQEYLYKSQSLITLDLAPELKNEIKSLINTFNNVKCKMHSVMQAASNLRTDDSEVDGSAFNLFCDDMTEDQTVLRNCYLKVSRIYEKKNIDLPILQYKNDILNMLENNQVLLIKGSTGSGKSIKVPQFIMNSYIQNNKGSECNILISEPRRIAAISLATQVAKERNESLGNVVGYHVRFSKSLPKSWGSILYCSTGILLRRLIVDPTLKGISHVIVDEIHERCTDTDMILKVLKDCLKQNKHIKLILMSATIDTKLFENYFPCAVLDVTGVTYPVKMHFLDDIEIFKDDLYNKNFMNTEILVNRIVKLIKWIIETKPHGSILCFLPGWEDIKETYRLLESSGMNNLLIIPLHSRYSNKKQHEVFKQVSDDTTKIILATNIAETSITITDVSYVIDSALKNEQTYDLRNSSKRMARMLISRSNLLQRKGRAGRVKFGESFHLITRKDYSNLQEYATSKILLEPLDDLIVRSKIYSDLNTRDFFADMIEPPTLTSIHSAVINLQRLGILDEHENLTCLGKHVSRLGLSAKLGKAVVLSYIFHCLDPIVSLAGIFDKSQQLNYSLQEERNKSIFRNLRAMYHDTSDHIAALKYVKEAGNTETDINNLTNNNIPAINNVQCVIMRELLQCDLFPLLEDKDYVNMHSNNNELIRAIIIASTNNVIKRFPFGYRKGVFTRHANKLYSQNMEHVHIDSVSINYKRRTWPTDLLTYITPTITFTHLNDLHVFDTSLISPLTVLLFINGNISSRKRSLPYTPEEKVCLSIDSIKNVTFICEEELANVLLTFRSILWEMVNFLLQCEKTDAYQQDSKEIEDFRLQVMCLLSRILEESSKDLDTCDNRDDTEKHVI